MHHVTLNNGHTRWSSREEVDPEVLGLLAPMARSGRHPIAQTDCHVSVTSLPGVALFTVEAPPVPELPATPYAPLATCAVIWTTEHEQQVWESMEKLHLQIAESGDGAMLASGALAASPDKPASLPWLAIVLLPGSAFYPQHMNWLGEFERCLAWAFLEGRPT
jgi:hypothetical protein